MTTTSAIVVLGCALRRSPAGVLLGAAGRRAAEGARAYAELAARGEEPLVVASGGRLWGGLDEADGLAAELTRLGVDPARVLHERKSLSTHENALYTAQLLRARGVQAVLVVTCAWHLPRAVALFRREGLEVQGRGADAPDRGALSRAWRWGRERVASRLDGVRP